MQKEELSNHSINVPTLLKRTENANDCTTSTWQEPNKNSETFLAVKKKRQRKGQQIEGNEEYDCAVQGRGETCRHLRQDGGPTCRQLRYRRQRGTKPIGRRAIGILSILLTLTTGEFFSELRQVSVAWRETSSQPTGCVHSTPTNTARTDLHTA